ncbi:MAG: cytochrome c oxidase subunit 3 [Thermomicrobiales bacterium]|jgi:cytochrome c oxidase subunit 3/cytochrome o ubiquinol oxidase subunit 3
MAQVIDAPRVDTHGTGHHEEGHGHSDHPPTSMGMDHRKILMWLFLASDCMFFGALIATYMIYRGRSEELVAQGMGVGPLPHELVDIPFTSVSAFVLLMSSLTMVLSLAALQKGNLRGSRVWLFATGLLGSIFLGGQYFEFTEFYHEGLGLTTNLYGASFFTLTGFHGTHVAIGVIWLFSLLFVSLRGGLKQGDSMTLEIAGLYWHFVDIVWIVIFTLVYLIPYEEVASEGGEEGARGAIELGQQAIRLLG